MDPVDDTAVDLIGLVRSAFAHLYDYAFLESHPLATLVDADWDLDQVTRARKLRRLLLECIEEIGPHETGDEAWESDRTHAVLTYRYIDGLPMDKIAEKRGLGVRQTYRVLRKGVEAIASMLQDRMRAPVAAGSASMVPSAIPSSAAHQTQLAQAEVSRLYQSGNIESLCVRDLLREVLTLLAPLCRREGSQIALSMAGAYPSVIAQRTVLRHGLLGLLTHALETTAQGDLAVAVCPAATGIRIEITGRVDDSKRLPSDPADEQQTGSGQAVAQTLIESQGGRVEVARREGQWRTQVFLPTEGRSTILVVDDNADLVALVKRYLTGYAVNTVGVTDASETLRLAGELRPRLILLDVLLPGQDGWEILRGLKRSPDTGDIPVVICSVLDERRLGETMGAVEYISKPVTQEHLLAVLGRWLGPLRPAV